ncbi:MAG: hypothetical protein D6723_10525 [Acidobacteria bacterium]|nr:MAG: hypothetical protein D6723_10525 [Acidobacteriota bacterium]
MWVMGVAVVLGAGCARKAPSEADRVPPPTVPAHTAASGKLVFEAPPGWLVQSPQTGMRVAQYELPRAEGDSENASLVVYYFGPGQGGSVEANLKRWMHQMEQPDGRPSEERARIEKMTVNGLNVTLLDLTGTYRAEIMPGHGARYHKPSFRMRAGVIETPRGPYFVKLVGPERTVNRWDEAFMAFIRSMRFQ